MGSIVSFPALLDKVTTLKDGSVKLAFETREFNPEDSAILFSLRNKEGHLLFADRVVEESDIPTEPLQSSVKNGRKSPSKRLRDVLWLYWRENGAKGDFEDYYNKCIEFYIKGVQEKLG